MTDNGTIEAFRGDEKGAIEPFRGDDTEAFSSGLFFIFFLCLFVFSSFPGVYKGATPPYSTFLSFPKSLIGNPPPTVIPEIFNRESKFLLFLWFLKTMDPGLKIAGVTRRWESTGECFF